MTAEDDIDGLAAEYVLGTLDIQERDDVVTRRRTDVLLDRAIKAWETRLAPLNDRIPGVEPPPYVFPSIAYSIWGRPVPSLRAARLCVRGRPDLSLLDGESTVGDGAYCVAWESLPTNTSGPDGLPIGDPPSGSRLTARVVLRRSSGGYVASQGEVVVFGKAINPNEIGGPWSCGSSQS